MSIRKRALSLLLVLVMLLGVLPAGAAAATSIARNEGEMVNKGFEFSVGVIDNLVMGWSVWDYSAMPFNLYGQICLPFTGLWFLVCIPAAGICRAASRRFHGI